MKHLKRLGLAGAVVLAMSGLAGSAGATQITPSNTVITGHAINPRLNIIGSGTVVCPTSVISGRTPTASATWVTAPITLTYSTTCTAGGGLLPATVEVGEACHTAAGTPILHVMGTGGGHAIGNITIPATCDITVNLPFVECTLTVRGAQTVTGVTKTPAASVVDLANALVPDIQVTNPTMSAACGPAGTTAGTLVGSYTVTPAVTIDGN